VKPVQKFSDEYLASCRQMTADQIIRFVEDFRRLHAGTRKRSRLISIKVPEDLLESFKTKARLNGRPYQSQIKTLMVAWLLDTEG
jgi:predicted DNA binding CopG/RHH family protein